MNIPQVNAQVTDVEKEKTKWVCELLGETYMEDVSTDANGRSENDCWILGGEELHNGSLTLDQCVGMLKELGCKWKSGIDEGWDGWYSHHGEGMFIGGCHPYDLTAALDALIKVLEEKK